MGTINAKHVDTCLPCYLTDSYSRPGQTLALSPTGLSMIDTVEALLNSIDFDSGIPEEITDNDIRAEFRLAIRYADLGPVIDDDDSGDVPYVYVLLEW